MVAGAGVRHEPAVAHALGEQAKVEIRHHRHEANDKLKKEAKDGKVSQDEEKRALDEIQKIVKKVGLPQDKAGRKALPEKDRFLTVGNLAERSGVSPRTIKHWEDKGIIEPDMRTEGGFRLYSASYVLICELIRDLQLFGYSLEEIKALSDDVRALLAIQGDIEAFPKAEVDGKLESMLRAVEALFDKMGQLKTGIERCEDLLKKKKKDIVGLRSKNRKRGQPVRGEGHA